jgi:thiol:disulfide interchange protein DsbA
MKFRLNKILIGLSLLVLMALVIGLIPEQRTESFITQIKEGDHYRPISSVSIDDTDFVIFFWYGCSHCLKAYEAMDSHDFEGKAKSKGFSIRKVPASGNPQWLYHAQLFYALDGAGMSHEGHLSIMKMIQSNGAKSDDRLRRLLIKILNEERVRNPSFPATPEWVLKKMKSKAVALKVEEGAFLASAAEIKGVPQILVKGKYLVSLGNGVSYADLPVIALKLADEVKP